MPKLLLLEFPKYWWLHWWGALRDAWWRIAVVAVAAVFPLLGFWRDELASADFSKAHHLAEIIKATPTSWLVVVFLVVLLLVTVEGTFHKAVKEGIATQQRQARFESEIAGLRASVTSLNSQLVEPRLHIEILEYNAKEIASLDKAIDFGGWLGTHTNNRVEIRLKLRIRNEQRLDTAIRPNSLQLKLGDHLSSDSKLLNGNYDATLSALVRYAQPIEGWALFTLEHATALSWVRYWMTVTVLDGNGNLVESDKKYLGWITPPDTPETGKS